jgi:spore coat polysaccharide biosynthesis protein SpsF
MLGILIIARLGSSRLSRKHLIEAHGRSFLEWMVGRINVEFKSEIDANQIKVVVATSDEPENRDFETLLKNTNVDVFYGSLDNIPVRQLQCAEHYGFSHVISVDGDDILCSTHAMRKVAELIVEAPMTVAKTQGLPLGMNAMGYSTALLSDALKNIDRDKKLETGWGALFSKYPELCHVYNLLDMEALRMTLDYTEDALFFKDVIEKISDRILNISDIELVEFIKSNKIYELNTHLNEEYFNNFNSQQKNQIANHDL